MTDIYVDQVEEMFPETKIELPKEVKGVWFIYGYDTQAYPVNVFEDELEARRAMQPWDHITFWEFGKSWEDLIEEGRQKMAKGVSQYD